MRPMSDFDPSQRCWLHEALNDVTFAWWPSWRDDYLLHADIGRHAEGIVNWQGLLLDGWLPWQAFPRNGELTWPWSDDPPEPADRPLEE